MSARGAIAVELTHTVQTTRTCASVNAIKRAITAPVFSAGAALSPRDTLTNASIVTGDRLALRAWSAGAALLTYAVDAALIASLRATGERRVAALIFIAEAPLLTALGARGSLFTDTARVTDRVLMTQLAWEAEAAELTDAVFTALGAALIGYAAARRRTTLTELTLIRVRAFARCAT